MAAKISTLPAPTIALSAGITGETSVANRGPVASGETTTALPGRVALHPGRGPFPSPDRVATIVASATMQTAATAHASLGE